MGLRIRCLELRVNTEAGPYGTKISFNDGLNILWADNTSGKSTCMMSILYALGMEGMLGPSQLAPFSGAMIDRLLGSDGRQLAVLDSFVRLEIENDAGERVAVRRLVTGQVRERQLISVELGPALSAGSTYPRRDFYVRTGGAATDSTGFHAFLADFTGCHPPEVTGGDGSRAPLYLETNFPFYFVEQISGWRDVKARMPTYLRIPEMAKRATEFILQLDVLQREIDRQSLEQQEARIRQTWRAEVESAKRRFSDLGVLFEGIPVDPVPVWPPDPAPRLRFTDGDEWFTADEGRQLFHDRLYSLQTNEIPRAEQASEEVLAKLRLAEDQLSDRQRQYETLITEHSAERSYVIAIDERLAALNEDLRKYVDAKKLQDRGGFSDVDTLRTTCPTCHQAISDVLLPQDRLTNPMSLEANIEFLRDQLSTFREMRDDSKLALIAKEKQLLAVRNVIAELSALIRSQKRTLRSDAEAPSVAAIQEQIALENRIERLDEAERRFQEFVAGFSEMASQFAQVRVQLKNMVGSGLSRQDREKLSQLTHFFLAQLREYEFGSYPVEQLSISEESYRPTVDGYELGVTSASDTIRVIWAYLLGLLEVARVAKTNHMGFVIFDEPKQQSAKEISFAALLKRASSSMAFGQQVIFSTSETRDRLESMIAGVECTFLPFEGRMLKSLPS